MLYIDSDVIIAMGVDMGEASQSNPDSCYPIGMKFEILHGSKTPEIVRLEVHACCSANEYAPYHFNGGVGLMHLVRRREKQQFTAIFVQTSIHPLRSLGFRQAPWDEQGLFNKFLRLCSKSVKNLPRGCKYQFSATRRKCKYRNKPVAIAHG